ncbi:MAG: tyrosine-type recombinase/integrase [Ignavibacteriaceae bacterium]
MANLRAKEAGIIPQKEKVQILDGLREKNRKHYQLIYFLLATGFRAGEALNLDFKDIDLKRDLILVKNAKSKRIDWFPIYPALREFIIDEFTFRVGKVFDFKNRHSLKFFERFLRDLGYNHYTLRALRKTFINDLVNFGLPITDVMVMTRLKQPPFIKNLNLMKSKYALKISHE